ncbi:MAG TPA: hypothetical protein VN420_03935 [Candidatus Fimivivens sp.]|nr:hypothetical protein [Candidatus Fimivivens sp.]
MGISVFVTVVAACLHGVAYFLYCVQAKRGASKPNPAALLIWVILSVVNAANLTALSDWVASLQFITGSVATMMMFVFVLFVGKLAPLKKKEWGYVALALVAIIVRVKLGDRNGAMLASFIILLTGIISVIPIVQGLLESPSNEPFVPWLLWTVAFLLTALSRYSQKGLDGMAVLSVIYAFLHGCIAVLTRRKA